MMEKPEKAAAVFTALACEVTGGAEHWPVFDRHGKRIHLGDRLRAQVSIGRFGQVRVIEVTVTEQHWYYCQFEGIATNFDFKGQVLRCYSKWEDVEHGHELWAEVI